jgi:hypothetical protein
VAIGVAGGVECAEVGQGIGATLGALMMWSTIGLPPVPLPGVVQVDHGALVLVTYERQ